MQIKRLRGRSKRGPRQGREEVSGVKNEEVGEAGEGLGAYPCPDIDNSIQNKNENSIEEEFESARRGRPFPRVATRITTIPTSLTVSRF